MSLRSHIFGSSFARSASCLSYLVAFVLLIGQAVAAPRTWIGGNVDWVDGGSTANWNPADEPDSDDEAIFNAANGVNLGSNNAVNGLTMSGGIDLFTNEFDLAVDGLVQVSGAGTNLFIGDAGGSVDADEVTINSGGTIEIAGGTLTLDQELATTLLDVNAGGALQGHGVVYIADIPLLVTTTFVNDGTLTAMARGATILSPPPVSSLVIGAKTPGSRIDLDGASGAGVVNVNRNQTLDVNIPIADGFSGTMNLYQNATFDMSDAWALDAGAINVDNGAIVGIPAVPSGPSTIAGEALTQTGGAINVTDTDGTLQLDAAFNMSGGTFTNSGTVIFNGATNITTAAGYAAATGTAETIINAAMTITDAAGNFNWDGPSVASTTINGAASLTINVNQVDTGDNVYGGVLTLNDSAAVAVNVAASSWTLANTLNKNNAGTSSMSGDRVVITGTVNANGGTLDMPATTTSASATLSVASTLTLGGASVFSGGAISGAGTLRMEGTSTVSANTTIDVATFDWDGIGTGTTHTIESGVAFTINSPTLDADGDMDDPINLAGSSATLTANGPSSWEMRAAFNANSTALGIANIAGTSRMVLAGAGGVMTVNGQTVATAPITFGASSTTTITAGTLLRINGGNLVASVNQIAGGTINGPGTLSTSDGHALRGFGAIGATIDFDGSSALLADDGTLTINGSIADVGAIGTFDADGTLHVTNAWNNNVSTGVQLNGGVLSGGTITNDVTAGISGHGLVTARVINNTQLFASFADSLILQTAGNDNDWDGTTNVGEIEAVSANIELRDNATFAFAGTVRATNNHTAFANGFALDFNPGSTLDLATGGTYESTNSTDLGGTVTVGAGGAKVKVKNNSFLSFEATSTMTLTGNLQLENNNIIVDAGATFSGGGALIIPDGSHMVADNLADIGVLLDMQGAFRPGNFNGIGRVDLFDYQQGSTGELFVELIGTSLNAFDRLVASGDVLLDGYLNIDIDEISPGVPFVPSLGQTFNIITGNTVSGTFDYADVSGMPDGLSFHINYLANAVQLQVVNTPLFSADFDEDGDVDPTDLAIWKGAFDLNQLGDADGDNDSDGADFLLWQQQFGSAPAVAVAQPATGAVPEPSAAMLLLVAMAGAGWHRSRDRLRA